MQRPPLHLDGVGNEKGAFGPLSTKLPILLHLYIYIYIYMQ